MTRLKKINAYRMDQDMPVLPALPDLATHCETCGEGYGKKDLDGGRCLSCGVMICAVSAAQLQAWKDEV